MVGQLVERIRKKDQRAMNQLYQMYVEELSSVCYRYVPDEDDAKDVLQNSFIKIFPLTAGGYKLLYGILTPPLESIAHALSGSKGYFHIGRV